MYRKKSYDINSRRNERYSHYRIAHSRINTKFLDKDKYKFMEHINGETVLGHQDDAFTIPLIIEKIIVCQHIFCQQEQAGRINYNGRRHVFIKDS